MTRSCLNPPSLLLRLVTSKSRPLVLRPPPEPALNHLSKLHPRVKEIQTATINMFPHKKLLSDTSIRATSIYSFQTICKFPLLVSLMIVWLVVGVQGSVERKKNQLWFGVEQSGSPPVDYELCYRLPAGFFPSLLCKTVHLKK